MPSSVKTRSGKCLANYMKETTAVLHELLFDAFSDIIGKCRFALSCCSTVIQYSCATRILGVMVAEAAGPDISSSG